MRASRDLVADLRNLGVRPGDAVMIHASLRAIGPVAGGPSGVLDALDQAVGEEGTLLMVMGAEIAHDWVNERPEAEREALLADAPAFDPLEAPVFHEVGYLAEAFRQRPGTLVTDNPSGRFGARGRGAERLLADAPWDDYYGPDSPLDKLCLLDGKILRLGADPDTTTALHYAEYLADVPGKRRVRRHYCCLSDEGSAVRSVSCLDDSDGIIPWDGEDYFALILGDYLATGRAKQGMVGEARSELIEARDLVAFGADWMTQRFRAQSSSSSGGSSSSAR